MIVLTWLKYVYAHRVELGAGVMAVAAAWTPIATLLARKIERPAPSASWWKRAIYDVFIDTPAWAAALGRSGIFGGIFNFPGMPSRQAEDNPSKAVQ